MSLACQKDSYLKEFTSRVKSCTASKLVQTIGGKKTTVEGFDVILEDTILFPEGGGQPDDRGMINDVKVLSVVRRGADAVHFVEQPFEVDVEVRVVVDWDRRWDHMQQHSGQHLVTAIISKEYGFETTSWNLGERLSFIELGTPEMSVDQMKQAEKIVNEKIRAAVPVYPTLFETKDDPGLASVRTRGLPDDHVGSVRVVTIEGMETNMCCGTHVSNLSHLQAIKLLAVEKAKKGRVNLVFVVGDRVLNYLSACYERETVFTSLLKGHPDDHVKLLEKLQNSFKIAQKNSLTLLREVAKFEAEKFKASGEHDSVFVLHRKEGDNEFMTTIANELENNDVTLFLTTGDEKGAGMFMLVGKTDNVAVLGPKIAELLDGKGAGKNGRFQGKANKMQKRAEAEALIRSHLSGGETALSK